MYKLKQINDVERQIKILNGISKNQLVVQKIDRYWKDKTLYECSATTEIEGVTKEECVFNALRAAQAISMTWEINGPFDNGANNMVFEGVFNEDTEGKPLKWAHFMLELKGL